LVIKTGAYIEFWLQNSILKATQKNKVPSVGMIVPTLGILFVQPFFAL
jgi:hypothetical protein